MTVARRRILLAGAASVLLPRQAFAQAHLPRVAIVFNGTRDSQKLATAAFVQGMREQGYVEGRNVELDMRYAEARLEALPRILREVLERKPQVIVLSGSQAIWAGRKLTKTVPIVMASVGDPVAQGLVKSLARPGANLTGLALMAEVMAAKRLELLREVLPKVSRVGRLYNPDNPAAMVAVVHERLAADRLGLELVDFEARDAAELDRALAAIAAGQPQAMTVSEDTLFANYGAKIVGALARIPSVFGWPQFVHLGGLLSYAAESQDQFRRAASYVRRILEGANPAELPVELARRFELHVNLKAAKALGIEVPQSVLMRADGVVE